MGLKKWLALDFSKDTASEDGPVDADATEMDVRQPAGHNKDVRASRRFSSFDPPRSSLDEFHEAQSYRQSNADGYDTGSLAQAADDAEQLDATPRYARTPSTPLPPRPSTLNQQGMSPLQGSRVQQRSDDQRGIAKRSPAAAREERFVDADEGTQRSRRNSLMDHIRFSWLGRSDQSDVSDGRSSLVAQDDSSSQRTAQTGVMPNDEDDEPMGVVMKGWLEKCGQQFKTWNWRFFVLRDDGVLSYYQDQTRAKLKGSIHVGYGSKADISVQSNMIDKKFVFMIATPQRNTIISAASQASMTKWIAKLHLMGAKPSQPWDPLNKTVNFFVRDSECPHEWKRYDDPTSYIHMEGCLLKRGHVNKNWKNRFFRIEKGELRYYTENQDALKGSVPLKGTIVSPGMTQCPDGRRYYFVITSRDGKFEMHLNAHNHNDMHHWIEALQEAQTALGQSNDTGTVVGLALVVQRAEEIPLTKIEVSFTTAEDVAFELERRTEALIVNKCPKDSVPAGSQLIAVEGRSILRESYSEARTRLRLTPLPFTLEFLLTPYKKGVLTKKSRSGFENWKRRVVIVSNGEIHYYKEIAGGSKKAEPILKHRKSFSLYGCYLNLLQVPGRDLCIVVARSPSDKLVLQTQSTEERIEWASVIYCSIRMVSQGITAGHIENLNLENSITSTVSSADDLDSMLACES